MGNSVSCSLAVAAFTNEKSSKVILPNGDVRQLKNTVKAADLMIETPNCFIVDSSSLRVARRFCPLSADADLDAASLYVMFPMHRRNTAVTSADMAALFLVAKKRSKDKRCFFRGRKSRVSPGGAQNPLDEKVTVPVEARLDGFEEISGSDFVHRISVSRSKQPLLETIEEESPLCSS